MLLRASRPLLHLGLTLALVACEPDAADSGPSPTPATDAASGEGPGDGVVAEADLAVGPDDASEPSADLSGPPADAASLEDVAAPGDTAPSTDLSDPTDLTDPTDPTDPADATEPAVPTLPEVRPTPVATHTTTLSPFTLQPGRETTRCILKRLDNTAPLWVTDITTRLAPGSHHLIVYKSDATEEQPTPFACDPFVETLRGETFPIMISQVRQETLSFPNGVAFRFAPNQMVRLEAHYLNYYPEAIEASAEVRFDGIAEADVVSEANLLFYGNPDLAIPPNASWTAPWRYLSVLPGTRVFALTGHTHAFGTGVDIQIGPDDQTEGRSVYPPAGQTFVWDEPPMAHFAPALPFDGSQGFRYRCAWNNTTDATLTFGESARQEMCFFWAYYYPSQGYRICLNPGSIGNGAAGPEMCCPGHWACDYIGSRL